MSIRWENWVDSPGNFPQESTYFLAESTLFSRRINPVFPANRHFLTESTFSDQIDSFLSESTFFCTNQHFQPNQHFPADSTFFSPNQPFSRRINSFLAELTSFLAESTILSCERSSFERSFPL